MSHRTENYGYFILGGLDMEMVLLTALGVGGATQLNFANTLQNFVYNEICNEVTK